MAVTSSSAAYPVGRQPALDGIRGIAVIAVLLFHTGYLRGGFLGVDIFFVLSGFLITRILLAGHAATGHFVSTAFWLRRARRLLPALVVLGVIILAYGIFTSSPKDVPWLRKDALACALYVQNYWYVLSTHTASRIAAHFESPLSHTWSLSVEEQYYLVWPVALGVLWARTRRSSARLLTVIILLMFGSAALMYRWYQPHNTARAFFSTETRAQALLAGAALSVAVSMWPRVTRRGVAHALEILGFAGAGFLGWMLATASSAESSMFHGGYLLVAVSVVVVIAAALQPASIALRRLLSFRPLAATGLISYGLYLFHVPILQWLARDDLGLSKAGLVGLGLLLTFAVAVLSYFFVERPILRGGVSLRSVGFVPIVAGGSVAVLLVISALAPNDPSALTRLFYGHQNKITPASVTKVLVAGDVQAAGLASTKNGYLGNGIHGVTVAGCDIAPGLPLVRNQVVFAQACLPTPSAFSVAVRAYRPDVTVLILGRRELLDRSVNGRALLTGSRELEVALKRRLESVRRTLTANDAKLILLTMPCGELQKDAADPIRQMTNDAQRITWFNSVLRGFANAHTDSVRLADYGALWCRGGKRVAASARAFRADGTFTPEGALATWRWLSAIVRDTSDSPAGR